MRHHAKSFSWAAWFLPRERRARIADLYALCRTVDDLSDEAETTTGRLKLLEWRGEIARGADPLARSFEADGLDRQWLIDLIDGALSDTDFSMFPSEKELDRYCYLVAGVVGLMMCPMIGVRSSTAWQHAVDLGSAMQLTNIARDIAEDATRGRLYVPLSWLNEVQITPEDAMRGAGVALFTQRLIQKAEGLYRSGEQGLAAIPARTRGAIAVALATYRDIGVALKHQGYDSFRGRAYVSTRRKIALSVTSLINCYVRSINYEPDQLSHNLTWRIAHADSRSLREFQHSRI